MTIQRKERTKRTPKPVEGTRLLLIVLFGLITLFVTVWSGGRPARGLSIGGDILSQTLCDHGDCQARGSYAADPYGYPNDATVPFGLSPYMKRGAVFSSGYFPVHIGGVSAEVISGTATLMPLEGIPFFIQFNSLHAEGGGSIDDLPGARLSIELPRQRLGVALGLESIWSKAKGWSIGFGAVLPVTKNRITVSIPELRVTVLDVVEDTTLNATVGVLWHGMEKDWAAFGAFVNRIILTDHAKTLNLETGEIERSVTTTNADIARFGGSFLPAVPLDLDDPSTVIGEILSDLRLGADLSYWIFSVPGEKKLQRFIGYFGADIRLLPDRLNFFHKYIRFYGIFSRDTTNGWGAGLGIYGNPEHQYLSAVSLNFGFSRRKETKSIGNHAEIGAFTGAVIIPF